MQVYSSVLLYTVIALNKKIIPILQILNLFWKVPFGSWYQKQKNLEIGEPFQVNSKLS